MRGIAVISSGCRGPGQRAQLELGQADAGARVLVATKYPDRVTRHIDLEREADVMPTIRNACTLFVQLCRQLKLFTQALVANSSESPTSSSR